VSQKRAAALLRHLEKATFELVATNKKVMEITADLIANIKFIIHS